MLTFEMIRIEETNRENDDENIDNNIDNLNHSRSNTITSLGAPHKFNKKESKNLPASNDIRWYEYNSDNLDTNADFDLSNVNY